MSLLDSNSKRQIVGFGLAFLIAGASSLFGCTNADEQKADDHGEQDVSTTLSENEQLGYENWEVSVEDVEKYVSGKYKCDVEVTDFLKMTDIATGNPVCIAQVDISGGEYDGVRSAVHATLDEKTGEVTWEDFVADDTQE